MYKVFINESSLEIVESAQQDAVFCPDDKTLWAHFRQLENDAIVSHLRLYHQNPAQLWEGFKTHFKNIKAAGGVVRNSLGQLLLIYRLGTWDLPKGKLEKGESPEDGAIREVVEECGIPAPKITGTLPDTFHVYRLKDKKKPVLKRTFWYAMELEEAAPLTPQLEENITRAEWCQAVLATQRMEQSYASLRELFGKFLLKTQG